MALTRLKYLLVALILLLAAVSYAYNDFLIQRLLELEKQSVELWARAIEFNSLRVHDESSEALTSALQLLEKRSSTANNAEERASNRELADLLATVEQGRTSFDFVSTELIIKERVRVPMVVVDEEGQIVASRYVEEEKLTPDFVRSLGEIHEPILIEVGSKENPESQSVYYGESNLVTTLRYYPYIQFGFILLLVGIGYTSYRSIVTSEQSNLWVGMTKEAAHQLGTPLSGMYGWIELLRDRITSTEEPRKKELEILTELEQDVQRLSTIAERFNKIGSSPELKPTPLKEHLEQSVEYMRRRLPKTGTQVELIYEEALPKKFLTPSLNPVLFQWVVENLIKNAADATASKIELLVSHDTNQLWIDVVDNGSGIEKKFRDEIFRPGFSTKKRGWGLGLTLTKRIVEQYHGGKIWVLRSEAGKGTTIRISLPILATHLLTDKAIDSKKK